MSWTKRWGIFATFGEEVYSPEITDIRDTKCLVLIGSHIGENMHNGQIQEMSDAIDKGVTIITVDPGFNCCRKIQVLASYQTFNWHCFAPGMDAWNIYNDYYDKKYVEKYCSGFDKLKEHVRDFTPEWAYGITTIKPDLIRKTAKRWQTLLRQLLCIRSSCDMVWRWYSEDPCSCNLKRSAGFVGRREAFTDRQYTVSIS